MLPERREETERVGIMNIWALSEASWLAVYERDVVFPHKPAVQSHVGLGFVTRSVAAVRPG